MVILEMSLTSLLPRPYYMINFEIKVFHTFDSESFEVKDNTGNLGSTSGSSFDQNPSVFLEFMPCDAQSYTAVNPT